MLADTLSITYNAAAVTLNKVTEANYASQYYGEASGLKFTLDVKHVVPQSGKVGESHLVKLSVEHFDAQGVYVRTVSPWLSMKTFDAVQDTVAVQRATKALVGLLTNSFVDAISARQS